MTREEIVAYALCSVDDAMEALDDICDDWRASNIFHRLENELHALNCLLRQYIREDNLDVHAETLIANEARRRME